MRQIGRKVKKGMFKFGAPQFECGEGRRKAVHRLIKISRTEDEGGEGRREIIQRLIEIIAGINN